MQAVDFDIDIDRSPQQPGERRVHPALDTRRGEHSVTRNIGDDARGRRGRRALTRASDFGVGEAVLSNDKGIIGFGFLPQKIGRELLQVETEPRSAA